LFGASTNNFTATDRCHTIFEIHTDPGGYNSGNGYYLQANSDLEFSELLPKLKSMVEIAVRKTKQTTVGGRIHKIIRAFFTSYYFQLFIAIMIIMVRPSSHAPPRRPRSPQYRAHSSHHSQS
jgi:hypothetical protein